MKIERIHTDNLASSPENLAARLRREKALFTNTAVNFNEQRREKNEQAPQKGYERGSADEHQEVAQQAQGEAQESSEHSPLHIVA